MKEQRVVKVTTQSRTKYIRNLTLQLKHTRTNSDTYLFLNTQINKFWLEEITNK